MIHRPAILVLFAHAACISAALAQLSQPPRAARTAPTSMPDSQLDNQRETRAQLSLLHASGIVQPGSTTTIALHFDIDPGWHMYFNGLAEEGMQPTWELTVPPGWRIAGEPLWPAPRRKAANELTVEHIYEKSLTLLIPIEVAKDAKPGWAYVRAEAKWIVCEDVCLSEAGEASVRVQVVHDIASGSPAEASPVPADSKQPRHIIARAAQAAAIAGLDSPSAAKLGVRAGIKDRALTFEASGEVAGLAFFPALGSTPISTDAEDWSVDGSRLVLELDPPAPTPSENRTEPTATPQPPIRAAGILEVRVRKSEGLTREYFRVSLEAPLAEPK